MKKCKCQNLSRRNYQVFFVCVWIFITSGKSSLTGSSPWPYCAARNKAPASSTWCHWASRNKARTSGTWYYCASRNKARAHPSCRHHTAASSATGSHSWTHSCHPGPSDGDSSAGSSSHRWPSSRRWPSERARATSGDSGIYANISKTEVCKRCARRKCLCNTILCDSRSATGWNSYWKTTGS